MKEKFIKNTILLIIGGIITKILGLFSKVILTRYLKTDGIGLYMMILPSFILFLNIASFGFPLSISKMVSEDSKNNKRLVFTSIFFVILINIILMIFIVLFAHTLSFKLLHNGSLFLPIICISLVLPFSSISAILRSYFFGKEKTIPHIVSNIVEDIVRIALIYLMIVKFNKLNVIHKISVVILSNIICELFSIVILFLFLPKNFSISKKDIIPSKIYLKESLSISVPTTLTRLITSISYFLEPIILTNILLYVGYDNNFIVREYGILSGFSMQIVLLPSFFTLAISQALLPVISKEYNKRNIKVVKRKIKQGIFYSLIIGISFTFILEVFPNVLLKYIYNTSLGVKYIRVLAPICLFQYIQAPLSSALDGLGMSKENFFSNFIGVLIRSIFLPIFSLLRIGIWGLVISTSLNIIAVTFINVFQVKRKIKESI